MPVHAGEVGELIITNLGRIGYPVIRYRSGDLVRLNEDICDCGRTFSRLEGGILGRVDDMIVVRGINIFPSALENLINKCNAVEEYRVIVSSEKKMRQLTIELELNEHKRLDYLLSYCESPECRRKTLLSYFDDISNECNNCDNCLNTEKK